MSKVVVWMDTEHAKLFHIGGEKSAPKIVETHEIRHHTSHEPEMKHHHEKLYRELAEKLKDAGEILLVGPGVAKSQFQHFLRESAHSHLNGKVVGVENADHPTDAQIQDYAKRYFKKYDALH